jgi:cytochrome oxidase assembly protein ShyY1
MVRGWFRGGDEPLPPTGEVDLVGWLQPSQDLVRNPDPSGRPNAVGISIPDLVQKTGVDLYSGFVVLDHARADGTDVTGLRQARLEESPSAGTWPGARNLFYGVEWWFFAGFAIFLWIKWMRDETREQAAREDAVPLSA